jgi:hypothetical protein
MTKVLVEQADIVAKLEDGALRVDMSMGREGRAATVSIAGAEAAPFGAAPAVVNMGTNIDAALKFVLPRGEQGPPGLKGDPGDISGSLDGGFFSFALWLLPLLSYAL